jgi:Bacterial TSP3 repeat
MSEKSALERVAASIALVSIAFMVAGTKACQEDYDVGGQSSISKGTGTPTAQATITGTITVTVTGTITTTVTAVATGSVQPSPTGDVGTEEDGSVGGVATDEGLLQELSVLGEKGSDDDAIVGGGAESVASKGDGNWLGKGFDGSQWEDSDGDGFSNGREERSEADPNDANSVPSDVEKGQLDSRIRQLDQDMDGLLNQDEAKRGTNQGLSDSDGDGRSDGAEVLSGGDPLDVNALYVDADGDGLSNAFEESKGFNPNSNDSDSDGLRDDLELVVGSNPLKVDSDGDGISDGREYDLNTDPLLGEPDRAG